MATHFIITFIFGFLSSILIVNSSDYSCVLNEDCNNFSGAYLVPDPVNCEQYYTCFYNGETYEAFGPSPCPTDFYFDQSLRTCTPEFTPGYCTNECCGNCNANAAISSCYATGSIAVPCNCQHYLRCPYIDYPPYLEDCFPYSYDPLIKECVPSSCVNEEYCYVCPNCFPPTKTTVIITEATAATGPTTIGTPTTTTGASTTTTGTSTTTTGTSTTTTASGSRCQYTFTCPHSTGNFKDCPYCAPTYWHCADGFAYALSCEEGFFFNPNDEYPFCLHPNDCPYP